MTERKLASVRIINDIQPIENADRIEVVTVDGWNVVCTKGKHSVGEKVVYFEIDSFLPEREEFEFLRKSSFKQTQNLGNGFRLRSIRLKKTLSQGLVMSLDELFELEEKDGELFIVGEKGTNLPTEESTNG